MKIGDLVMKVGGYGAKAGWTGIVLGYQKFTTDGPKKQEGTKLVVMTNDGIENWVDRFCEVVSESR